MTAAREAITASPAVRIDRPLLTMSWRRLTYVHWALPSSAVQARLPAGLTVDELDGVTYVGLVPFVMGGIGLALPGGSAIGLPYGTFPETNVRTYVVGPDGGRGVFFHSLDVTRLAPTVVARRGYRLPYGWSQMRTGRRSLEPGRDRYAYRSVRRWPAPRGATSHLIVDVAGPVVPSQRTPLDDFLSARWSLYVATPSGAILRALVDHPVWPLRHATVAHLDDRLLANAGYGDLAAGEPAHVRFGGDVQVRVGPPRRVG